MAKRNLTISPDGKQAWSCGTQMFATVKYPSDPSDPGDPSRTRTITLGNVTKYSPTTSTHRNHAGAWVGGGGDILLVRVPLGTSDPWRVVLRYAREPAHHAHLRHPLVRPASGADARFGTNTAKSGKPR